MIRIALFLTALLVALPARAEVNIQVVASPAGTTAWLVEEHSIPFVALELRFRGGGSLDLPGKRGATNLMVGLLEEGAGDMDAREFARQTEGLAASFSYNVYDDTVTVSAKFLTENRDQAVALLRESLINPRLDADAIERVRAQILSSVRSDEKDPSAIAGRSFDHMVYGDHPYGSDLDGTVESVTGLTRDDLVAAHRAALSRDGLYIGAVGDITGPELGALVDILLAGVPDRGGELPDPVVPTFPGGINVVDFDTPQSVVQFGQSGIAFEDPDYFAAYLLNVILGGGGFDSRLMQEVREKRGLTYGVYSYLVDKDQADIWKGSVASANDRVAEAISVIRAEWTKMRDSGVTEQELQDAKTYLTGAYPLRFDGNGPIANIMVGMQMAGMPVDYIATRNDRVNAVTLDDVNRIARTLLDPDRLSFVVVGRPEGLAN